MPLTIINCAEIINFLTFPIRHILKSLVKICNKGYIMDGWQALVNAVMNLRVTQNAGNFMTG
jgi:hypothetical protein